MTNLQKAESLEDWIKNNIKRVVRYTPEQWRSWSEDNVLKALAKTMWKHFIRAWNGHEDERFLTWICLVANKSCLMNGCNVTLERAYDKEAGEYTKNIKYRAQGGDNLERYRLTDDQAARKAAGKQGIHGPSKTQIRTRSAAMRVFEASIGRKSWPDAKRQRRS